MNHTILLIEDDAQIQDMYTRAFEHAGQVVRGAATGQEGLRIAKEEHPGVILLDLMLGQGMNGFDVLENLKRDETTKSIPVIVMTNLDTEQKIAADIGAVDYFVKADTPIMTVVEKVRSLLTSEAN